MRRAKLNLRILPNEPGGEGRPLVLIEGDKKSLEDFGNLILDHARNPQDCGLQFFAGQAIFDLKTELGLYIHRLPCRNEVTKKRAPRKSRT